MFITVRTSRRTAKADSLIATAAAGRTLFTKYILTEVAIISIFTIRNIAALVAGLTIPFFQAHVRTVRAVGIQDAFYQHEEIAQSVPFQSSPYGGSPLALAKPVVAYVRMSYLFIRRSRMRVEGYATVRDIHVKLGQLL